MPNPQPKQTEDNLNPKCEHAWEEDEMFACGAITIIAGSPKDLGEETRMICKKCNSSDYIRTKDLGTLNNLAGYE